MTPIEFTYEEYLCNAKVTTRDGDEVIYVFENEKDCLGLTYIAKYNDEYYHMDCDMNGRTSFRNIRNHDLIITERGAARICTHAVPEEPIVITCKSFADLTETEKRNIYDKNRRKIPIIMNGVEVP